MRERDSTRQRPSLATAPSQPRQRFLRFARGPQQPGALSHRGKVLLRQCLPLAEQKILQPFREQRATIEVEGSPQRTDPLRAIPGAPREIQGRSELPHVDADRLRTALGRRKTLTTNRLHRTEALLMIKRRAKSV